VIIIYRATQLC